MYKWLYMHFCVQWEQGGELCTHSRKAAECMYELYMHSQLVEVLRDHQQILFVDGHVCKSTK